MKNIVFILALSAVVFPFACNNVTENNNTSENDIDAARNFIRAALDGKFDAARNLMLQDSTNLQYLDAVERNYKKMDRATKSDYHASSITIHLVKPVNDSATIIIYSNSFKKDQDTLKVLKTNHGWLIDLKYLFTHDSDTAHYYTTPVDSIK